MIALPRDRRVVALDFPGAGYSGVSYEHSFGFREMAEVVREAIARLGMERPVLLGHSHGGAIALELAQNYPDELNSLVLLCPAHPFSGRENALVSFYLSRVGRAFGHMLPHLPDWLHLQAFRRMPGSRRRFGSEEVAPYLHTLRKPGTVDHLLALLKSWKADMEALRIALEAKPLEVPTLLLWGDRDVVVPLSSAAELKRHIRECELLTLACVGHLPNEEEPEECAALILRWLDRNQTVRSRQPIS